MEEGAEFTGQSGRRELVFALLLGTDDFPGGGGGVGRGRVRPGTSPSSVILPHQPAHSHLSHSSHPHVSPAPSGLSPAELAPPGLVGVKEALA